MAIINKMMGNAVVADTEKTQEQLEKILSSGERVELVFKQVRDMIVITSRRILIIDKQGVTGKKVEYFSIPYKSIISYAVETAGHVDLDFELKIWLPSRDKPIIKTLKRNRDAAYELLRLLGQFVG